MTVYGRGRCWLLLLLLLLLPQSLLAAWDLPSTVAAGDVALLQWRGANPPDLAVGRFADQTFYLERDAHGRLFALIGIDIDHPLGPYPLQLVSFDRRGTGHQTTLTVHVVDKDRGDERLTLPQAMVTPQKTSLLRRIKRENRMLRQLFARSEGVLRAGPLRRPVPDSVSSRFGKRRILNGVPRSPHSGTDFRSPFGRKIRAPARGKVVYVGDLYYTGRTVIVDHGAGLYSLFAHLSSAAVKKGETVAAGRTLGKVGSSGRSTGAHLHWTVRLRGARVDPMSLLRCYGAESP